MLVFSNINISVVVETRQKSLSVPKVVHDMTTRGVRRVCNSAVFPE